MKFKTYLNEEITSSQQKRIENDFQKYAGDEKIEYELINDTHYAYGSELGTLRILKAYKNSKKAKQDYSKNLKTFYFSLSTS